MPLLHRLEEAGLVDHELRAGWGDAIDARLRRQLHRRGLAAGALLEGAVQGAEQLPVRQPPDVVMLVSL
jgi:hypothetical protein